MIATDNKLDKSEFLQSYQSATRGGRDMALYAPIAHQTTISTAGRSSASVHASTDSVRCEVKGLDSKRGWLRENRDH